MTSSSESQSHRSATGADSAPDPRHIQAVDAYEADVKRFAAGELDLALFKPFRAACGVYEQRRDGTFMVRVRIPGGLLTVAQAQAVAAAAADLGGGYIHVTTRQDVQIHDVSLSGTVGVMRRMLGTGLACAGTGGNTVRNVLVCPFAGVCPHECFDVRPTVSALNRVLPELAAAYKLPRKFKIAVSGCDCDCALAAFTDLGLVARLPDARPGFAVYAGGGMGMSSRVADRFEEWVAPADVATVTQALLCLFDRYGDRQNRAKARLRHAVDRFGLAAMKAEYATEKAVHAVRLSVPEPAIVNGSPITSAQMPWRREQTLAGLRVVPQRQAGLVAVAIHPSLGLVSVPDLLCLAAAAAEFSDEQALCLTPFQSVLLRHVRSERLPALAQALQGLAPTARAPAALNAMIVCTSADTCRLGACLSRDTARSLAAALDAAGLPPDVLSAADIRISGCGNCCAQSPVGDIGLTGTVRRIDGMSRPHYKLLLGARRGSAQPRFGQEVAILDAESVPSSLVILLREYAEERLPDESFPAFVERAGKAVTAGFAAPGTA